MAFAFSDADVERIASVLGVTPKRDGSLVRFELHDAPSGRRLTLEIQMTLALPPELSSTQPANLVSVYAPSSFLQLQGCTGFLASKELGEVIFVAKHGGRTNGLVVEREAGCSLYANVDDRLFSTDFTRLPPEMIMSSVALSMTESLFDDLG
ncbi:MAG: hypothetical protein KatS3mg043_2091 [Rhodothermaceae bacterium]|nr:MAG: hypothetical protein KatS3mg043_2091 [Rhodothermaceae bacterium]